MKSREIFGAGVVAVLALAGTSAQQLASPASFRDGPLPEVPYHSGTVGGGEVLLELTVASTGSVSAVRSLRVTASFADRVTESVRAWTFNPAQETLSPAQRQPGGPDRRPVESRVLVAALFRPPTLQSPTLGEPIVDVATASTEVPTPLYGPMPPYPPTAHGPGVVLVELRVDPDGSVGGGRVVRSAPPFDGAALDAAFRWRFDPARFRGIRSPALVYVIFGFPLPVV